MADRDLSNYDVVKSRKSKFYLKYGDGRIVVEALTVDDKTALFKATIYKNRDDQKDNLPLSMGYAQEFRGVGGFANKSSWCENCEESAVGRALDNGGFSSDLKCSQEEIEIAQNNKKVLEARDKELSFKQKIITDINTLLSSEWENLSKINQEHLTKNVIGGKVADLVKLDTHLIKSRLTEIEKYLEEIEHAK